MIKNINNELQNLEEKIRKNHLYLSNKIKNKTLSDEDLEKYKRYFNNSINLIVKFDFYETYRLENVCKIVLKEIEKKKSDWKNIKDEDKLFFVTENEFYEINFKLIPLDTIILYEKEKFLLEKLNKNNIGTISILIKDFLYENISLEQLINFLNIKKIN